MPERELTFISIFLALPSSKDVIDDILELDFCKVENLKAKWAF